MISNRTRRSCLAISDGMQMEILFKNAAFLTSRIFASAMIRVFPSLEHSTGHVRTPKTICRTFVCRTCPRRIVQTWKRHGIRCKYLAERNALNFSQRIFHPHFHLKSKGMIPSSYFFSRQTGLPAESDSPVFWCNGQKKPVYLPDICSSCFMIIFLTISPPMLPACAEVKSPL